MPSVRVPVLTVLAAAVLTSVLLTPTSAAGPAASRAGVVPLTVPATLDCAGLTPPLASGGRAVPPAEGEVAGLGDDGPRVEVRAGAVLRWDSERPVRAALVAGPERAHLYWYDPAAANDAGLRPPPGPDGAATAIHAVELCHAGGAPVDLVDVCLRGGHVPLTAPLTYRGGRFTGTTDGDPPLELTVDPEDGTLSWRSPDRDVTAVATRAGAADGAVLVEYDPPARAGADVPFLGDGGTPASAGEVLVCGIGVVRTVPPTGRTTAT